MNNLLTQDLATVNMLMTALNLTKDQATGAITEAPNGRDDDKDTDISRFQQVQDAQMIGANGLSLETDRWGRTREESRGFRQQSSGT